MENRGTKMANSFSDVNYFLWNVVKKVQNETNMRASPRIIYLHLHLHFTSSDAREWVTHACILKYLDEIYHMWQTISMWKSLNIHMLHCDQPRIQVNLQVTSIHLLQLHNSWEGNLVHHYFYVNSSCNVFHLLVNGEGEFCRRVSVEIFGH